MLTIVINSSNKAQIISELQNILSDIKSEYNSEFNLSTELSDVQTFDNLSENQKIQDITFAILNHLEKDKK